MKISILFIFVFTSFSFSQYIDDYRLGLKLGANLSHIVRDQIPESKFNESQNKLGYIFGIIVEKPLNKKTSVQVELLYNQVGSMWGKTIWNGNSGDYAIYNLSYISVPICFQFDSRIGYLLDNFDLSLGLSYSYNIYAKQEMFVETYHKLNYGPNNIRNEINHHEVGILSGIRFPFYKKRIYISFQYYWAITRLYRIRTIVYPDQLVNKEEFRNRSFNISFDVFLF